MPEQDKTGKSSAHIILENSPAPLQESSGPSGPKCPWECPRECLQTSGCGRKCPGKCPWGPSKSALKVSKKCLFRHKSLFGHILGRGSKDPWSTPSDTPRHTPLFGDTLSGTSRGTSGPKGPKTLVGGRVFLKYCGPRFKYPSPLHSPSCRKGGAARL